MALRWRWGTPALGKAIILYDPAELIDVPPPRVSASLSSFVAPAVRSVALTCPVPSCWCEPWPFRLEASRLILVRGILLWLATADRSALSSRRGGSEYSRRTTCMCDIMAVAVLSPSVFRADRRRPPCRSWLWLPGRKGQPRAVPWVRCYRRAAVGVVIARKLHLLGREGQWAHVRAPWLRTVVSPQGIKD